MVGEWGAGWSLEAIGAGGAAEFDVVLELMLPALCSVVCVSE